LVIPLFCFQEDLQKTKIRKDEQKNEKEENLIAKVKFHKSLSDNTGNNYFDYLARIGGSMWASQECLHKDTEVPNG
jgi:hypothetical protein